MNNKTYIAIDLKSFYASVEAMERGLDPMTTNLLVADLSRTEKTICLAVSPSLKAYGISGRARMFEVIQQVKNVNSERLRKAPGKRFTGSSFDDNELNANPNLSIDYVVAVPRMALYIEYSTRIYTKSKSDLSHAVLRIVDDSTKKTVAWICLEANLYIATKNKTKKGSWKNYIGQYYWQYINPDGSNSAFPLKKLECIFDDDRNIDIQKYLDDIIID